MGRMLILAGVLLIVAGLLWVLGERFGLGHLPGDFHYKGDKVNFYFPLTTCILISAVISVLLWVVRHFFGE